MSLFSNEYSRNTLRPKFKAALAAGSALLAVSCSVLQGEPLPTSASCTTQVAYKDSLRGNPVIEFSADVNGMAVNFPNVSTNFVLTETDRDPIDRTITRGYKYPNGTIAEDPLRFDAVAEDLTISKQPSNGTAVATVTFERGHQYAGQQLNCLPVSWGA